MSELIIFDSDFIIANVTSLKEYLDKLKEYKCYTTEITLEEVAKNNSFKKMNIIDEFKQEIKNYQKLGIDFKNNNDEIKNIIENGSKEYIKEIFNRNIIRHHDRKMEVLLKRAYEKVPPFGKSDTGFKDTIILLDIMDYLKGKNIKKAYFITNDEDYIKPCSEIGKEVNEKTGCDFIIVDGKNVQKLLNFFKVGTESKINKLTEEIDNDKKININIMELREKLNDVCYKLFYYEGYDPFDEGEYIGKNFRTDYIIPKDLIEKFLEKLSDNINKNIFNSKVVMSDFFENPFLFKSEQKIDIECFERLNEVYLKIKNNSEFKNALLNLLYSNFCDLATNKYYSDLDGIDLPF